MKITINPMQQNTEEHIEEKIAELTEAKAALERKVKALEESEARFRLVFENANESIAITQDEIIKYCNPQFAELSGYSIKEIQSMNFINFVCLEDQEMVKEKYKKRISGIQPKNNYSICIIAKDGEKKNVFVNSTLIDWEGKPAVLVLLSDISELKKAESELKRSQERYELAISGSAAGIWDWDIPSNHLYTSSRLKTLLGYDPDEVEITMEEFWGWLHPEDIETVQQQLEKHLKDHSEYVVDYRLKTKSGDYRWFYARGQAMWDEKGTAIRMSGSISDITQRKTVESDLSKSDERYKLAVAGSDVGIWDWDIVNDKAFFSERFKSILGYSNDDWTIVSLADYTKLIHPDDKDETNRLLQEYFAQRQGIFSRNYRLRTKRGGYRWFHVSGKAVWGEHGNPIRAAGSLIDIHEQKHIKEEIIKSESRFRQLMEQSPLAMEILAPTGEIRVYNSAWKKLWEIDEQGAQDTIAVYNMLTDPQIKKLGILPQVEKAFTGKHVILPPIQYNTTDTKTDFDLHDLKGLRSPWIQCHLNSVKDEDGEIAFIVNTYVDITDLKKAEEEAKEQRDVLARIDRASSMGQLTGSIAHELNQPLTGILGNAQAAEMMLKNHTADSSELLNIMQDIVSDTKRASDVIRNLRDLYREQKGEFVSFDINDVIKETLVLMHSEMIKYDAKPAIQLAEDIPKLKGNKVQIQQVVVNLILNALEAMMSINARTFNLKIVAFKNNRVVTVYIDDEGPGIDMDKIDRIFEPLATWKSGGTGMGLAISNSILESHGGNMFVKNLEKGGARVGLNLPIFDK